MILSAVRVIRDARVHVCGRVWLQLDPDKHTADEVYSLLVGTERANWSMPDPMSVGELLAWAVAEGLVYCELAEITILSTKGTQQLITAIENSIEVTSARLLTAGANLRGNLRPSTACAAVRSLLNGEPGVTVVPEPEPELEALLAGNSTRNNQVIVVASWRRPAHPARWVVLRPGMSGLDQLLAYQERNAEWATCVEAACLAEEG